MDRDGRTAPIPRSKIPYPEALASHYQNTRGARASGTRLPLPVTGGIAPALHLATTFARDETGTPLGGHTYIRESNPNQSALEAALAPLEGGQAALVFASAATEAA